MNTLTIPETSVEYVVAEITAPTVDVSWPVDLAVIPEDQRRPAATDWHNAQWEGSGARLLVGPGTAVELECGTYSLWVKIVAAPETAVRRVGTVKVI